MTESLALGRPAGTSQSKDPVFAADAEDLGGVRSKRGECGLPGQPVGDRDRERHRDAVADRDDVGRSAGRGPDPRPGEKAAASHAPDGVGVFVGVCVGVTVGVFVGVFVEV